MTKGAPFPARPSRCASRAVISGRSGLLSSCHLISQIATPLGISARTMRNPPITFPRPPGRRARLVLPPQEDREPHQDAGEDQITHGANVAFWPLADGLRLLTLESPSDGATRRSLGSWPARPPVEECPTEHIHGVEKNHVGSSPPTGTRRNVSRGLAPGTVPVVGHRARGEQAGDQQDCRADERDPRRA